MTSRAFHFLAMCFCSAVVLAAAPSSAQDKGAPPAKPPVLVEDPNDMADRLHTEGVAASETGDWPTAYAKLSEAFKLKESYDIAANLGNAALELKKFPEAAERLDWARDRVPTGKTKQRAQIEERLAKARAEVATVRFNVNAAGADVRVDGKSAGTSPFEKERYFEPGKHQIDASCAGYKPTSESRDLPKGKVTVVELTLLAAKDGAPHGGSAPNTRYWPIVGTGIGLTVVAVAAGGGLMGAAAASGNSADAILAPLKQQYGERPCDRVLPECADIKSKRDRHDTLFKASLGAFGAAGLFAVVTVIYAAADRPSTKPQSARLVPVFSSSEGGIAFFGTW